MTSLIFGSIYMGHRAFTEHRREKQRVKNYERWDSLRDDYDAQRKISRETRSLDLQRTGTVGPWDQTSGSNNSDTQLPTQSSHYQYDDRPILTLRDQQEANDARTSWRPQEVFDGPPTGAGIGRPNMNTTVQRHVSMPTTTTTQLQSQATGSTWDTPLPAPLRVSRRSYEDYEHQRTSRSASVSTSRGQSPATGTRTPDTDRRVSTTTSTSTMALHGSSNLRDDFSTITQQQQPEDAHPNNPFTAAYYDTHKSIGFNSVHDDDAVRYDVPGGRMAELLDAGSSLQQQQPYQQQSYQTYHPQPIIHAGGPMAELIERGY